MGDNETNNFDILKKNLNPTGKIEIFKVGHHGSKKSINKTMANFLNPQISIISVGENAYGHPHPKTLSHLKKSKIFRTDKDNAIKIKTNGKKYSIYTYNSKTSNWDKK